jgi:exopolysaccharide biosynthesis protein
MLVVFCGCLNPLAGVNVTHTTVPVVNNTQSIVSNTTQTETASINISESAGFTPIFKGVYYSHQTISKPRINSVHIVTIDLLDSNVSFIVTPPAPVVSYPSSETRLQNTLEFASQQHVQVAVNANFFNDLNGGSYQTGDPADNIGLSASNGSVYSPYDDDRPALVITKENRAFILDVRDSQPAVENAVAGFSRILVNGTPTPCSESRCTTPNPRTTAGISKDGRYLIIITVDGRQPGVSEGLSLAETADLMLSFGSYDALELDGGGSTTLVIADPEPRVVNIPVGVNNQPGTLRPVGSSLGVYAAPLQ